MFSEHGGEIVRGWEGIEWKVPLYWWMQKEYREGIEKTIILFIISNEWKHFEKLLRNDEQVVRDISHIF